MCVGASIKEEMKHKTEQTSKKLNEAGKGINKDKCEPQIIGIHI